MSDNQSETVRRCRSAMIALGYHYPFFLPALARLDIREARDTDDTPTETMSINGYGIVRVNVDYAAGLSDVHLAGVMCHEIGHLLLMHHERGGSRVVPRWFRACDRAWNQSLREMGIQLPGGIFPPPGMEAATAEDLYDVEPDQPDDDQPAAALSGCGVGAPQDGDESADGETYSPEGQRAEWEQVSLQAQALARGTTHADVMFRALALPRPRVPWATLLRNAASRALAAHGRDDQTMAKRSRRSADDAYMPGWKATKARIAVILDTSGSVTDDQVVSALAEIAALSRLSGIKIYVALHDSRCYWHGWVKPGENISGHVTGRGGTNAESAYRAVRENAGKVDVLIHATDGYIENPWPTVPCNRFIFGVLGDGKGVTPPSNAHVVPIVF